MAELFNHNPYVLRIGSFEHECFSVLGFSSEDFSFNHDYRCVVTFRLRQILLLSTAVHQPACLGWEDNFIHGVVSRVDSSSVVISSPLYLLNQRQHSRVYADMCFQDLMKAVLENNNFQYKLDFNFLLKSTYPVLSYIAQYQETDLEFIQRQCSRWGIFFGFVQQKTRALLIFCDDSLRFSQQFHEIHIPFEKMSEYKKIRKVLPKTVIVDDYNPDTPELSLKLQMDSTHVIPGYGVDNRPYEFYQTQEQGRICLKNRMEYYDCQREVILAEIDYMILQLGQSVYDDKHFYVSALKFEIDILDNKKHVNLILIDLSRTYRPVLPQLFHMPDCTAQVISDAVDHSGCYYISPDYDERKTSNAYPVRLSQPCTGENNGFHFPLIKHTPVLITHINGDPDRPVVLGVIPGGKNPNLVTAENHSQHILKTPAGNQWLMDDDESQACLKFNSTENQAVIHFFNDQISLSADKNILLNTSQQLSQKVVGNFIQTISGNHKLFAKNNYEMYSEKGDMSFSSGKNLIIHSHQANINASQLITLTSHAALELSSHAMTVTAKNTDIKAKHAITLESVEMVLESSHKIMLCVSGSSLIITSAGITLNAASVNFNTPSFNSSPPQLGASDSQSAHTALNLSQFYLDYRYLENSVAVYTVSRGEKWVYSGSVCHKNTINNIAMSDKLTIHHAGLPVISVDGKSQKPADYFELHPVLNKHHQITVLKKPVYKKISHQHNEFDCELLTSDEIQYFKEHADNAVTVFIHGYDIEDGHFGRFSYIRTPQEGFCDDTVNGTGAHNWLLHMEYNLNCAHQQTYLEFPWETNALAYRRVLGLHWPGYQRIYDIPYSTGLNFAGMEFNAIQSGYAVLKLIKQLKSEGLNIQIIAHSLGCLVALQLMDLLGREHQYVIDQIILWEAAVARTALSPVVINALEERQKAARQTLEGEAGSLALPPFMLYEYYGEFLRQKAANFKHIPPWEVFEKDPFEYFPYAHIAAKKIRVLMSRDDDVLKYDYRANAIFAGLPHLNFIHHAMGLEGPDENTSTLLKSKLLTIDQQDWLAGHSAMRIPSKNLFEHIYIPLIEELWKA